MRTIYFLKYLLLLSFLLGHVAANAANELTWKAYANAPPEISVHYRTLEHGQLEIKAERTLNSTLGAFLHLLEDVGEINHWVDQAESATIIARPQPRQFVVMTRFSGAVLVADRLMITASEWTQNKTSLVLTFKVQDASADYPITSDAVMMQHVSATWTLTPLENKKLTIQYIGSAHPGGRLPMFLARSQALTSITKTFENLPAAIANHQRPYPGVIELN